MLHLAAKTEGTNLADRVNMVNSGAMGFFDDGLLSMGTDELEALLSGSDKEKSSWVDEYIKNNFENEFILVEDSEVDESNYCRNDEYLCIQKDIINVLEIAIRGEIESRLELENDDEN